MTESEPNGAPLDFDKLPLFAEPASRNQQQKPAPAQHLAAAIKGTSTTPTGPTWSATPARPEQARPTFASADPASVPSLPETTVTDPQPWRRSDELDWALVSGFRAAVSDRLTAAIAEDSTLDGEARLEVGRAQIVQVLRDHVDALVRHGQDPWNEDQISQMQKAIFDSLFRLGRLQQYVDDPRVENVMVFGYDEVYIDYGGGQIEQRASVADSDQQLIEDIQFLASRDGERGRPFSAAAWKLSLSLPDGERLQAIHPPIVERPVVIIRRTPLITITLRGMVESGTLTPSMAEFLTAAVRARKSFVISGQQGAGKTTLLRSLAHAIPPHEHIVTIESERELHLKKSGLHPLVSAFEGRPGQGEPAPDGTRPGEVTAEEMLEETWRMNTQRIIYGEVRSAAAMVAMLQVMQGGAGSMSTIHTTTAARAVGRMAVLLARGLGVSSDFGYEEIGQNIDFVIQISNHLDGNGTIKRFVSEICELVPGEGPRPIAQKIFAATKGEDVAKVVGRPQDDTLEDLVNAGFSTAWLLPGADEGTAA